MIPDIFRFYNLIILQALKCAITINVEVTFRELVDIPYPITGAIYIFPSGGFNNIVKCLKISLYKKEIPGVTRRKHIILNNGLNTKIFF